MRTQHIALALLATLAAACGAAVTPGSDAGREAGAIDVPTPPADSCGARVPAQHRAAGATCPATRPAETCDGASVPGSTCTAHTDCTMGTNGRCTGDSHNGCRCTYDRCQSDSDCTEGGPCVCRSPSRSAAGANVCVAGNCRTDGDCGPCGYCSPTLSMCGDFGGVTGFYCHTPADECTDDADCASVLDAGFVGQRPYCFYDPTVSHWKCSNSGCAG